MWLIMSGNWYRDKYLWGINQCSLVSSIKLGSFLIPCPTSGKPKGWCLNPPLFRGVATSRKYRFPKIKLAWEPCNLYMIAIVKKMGYRSSPDTNIQRTFVKTLIIIKWGKKRPETESKCVSANSKEQILFFFFSCGTWIFLSYSPWL